MSLLDHSSLGTVICLNVIQAAISLSIASPGCRPPLRGSKAPHSG